MVVSRRCQSANLAAAQVAHTMTQQGFVQNSAPNGVIGMLVDDQTNQIMRIYGESDLNTRVRRKLRCVYRSPMQGWVNRIVYLSICPSLLRDATSLTALGVGQGV